MNTDELRTALHEPTPVPLTVDLAAVLSRGRRRRGVRRATVPLAVLATAAAVAVPVVGAHNGSARVETAGGGTAGPTAAPSRPAPGTVVTGRIPADAFADVIGTGERVGDAERVFSFFRAENDARSHARFLIGMGYRTRGVAPRYADGANEDVRQDDATGFSGVGYTGPGSNLPAGDWAVFGDYAGPAATITARVDGRPVTARTARWPGYPRIVVFWFSPGTGSPRPSAGTSVTDLRAYDAAGRPLPSGPHAGVYGS